MHLPKKIISLILTVAMTICLIPASGFSAGTAEAVSTLNFATMSDIHYYPQSLTGNGCEEWIKYCRCDAKEYEESEAIVDTALETLKARAEAGEIKYLLIPGDLTRYSELEAHRSLAEKLKNFEAQTGVSVVVINGNHDININKACTFENGTKEAAESITPQGFYDTYKELGYDIASDFYAIKDGVVSPVENALSYTVDLDEYTQLIVVDSCKYSFADAEKDKTDGAISDDCMKWITEKADAAAKAGKTNLLMVHHSVAAHMECEPSVTFAFVLDDYLERAEELADHNIHYAFTGHLHIPDIAQVVNDNGEVITDCQTSALTSFPNQYRENSLTVFSDGTSEIRYEEVDFDAAATFTVNGVEYAQGAFGKTSFGLCFGGALSDGDGVASVEGFVKGLLLNYGGSLFNDIKAEGGLLKYLTAKGIDLRDIIGGFLEPYIGDGIKVGGKTVLSVDNIMWFLEDLAGQIDTIYINDIDNTWALLLPAVEKLANMKMSDCTVAPDVQAATGIGAGHEYATLEDVLFTAIYYFYTGNEKKFGDDALLKDVYEKLNEKVTENSGMRIFGELIDIVYNDVLNYAILGKLSVRLDKLFGNTCIGNAMGKELAGFVNRFLRNDTSYLNLVNTIFSLGALPYTSLYDVLDQLLLREYWTDSQDESFNMTLAYFINDFATDEDPCLYGDYSVTYGDSKKEVEVTTDNYRLPTMVSVTLGDSPDSANINWFSKYSLPEGDIEIYKLDGDGTKMPFTGSIEKSSAPVTRYFPGIDLGFIGFIKYRFTMVQHTVKLTGLEPGTKYVYTVGNAARGWWSDEATLETQDGSDDVTFFHMSDPQSQSEKQYKAGWANVVSKAFEMYPEAKFIAVSGDLVDYGMNNKMWQWMFDTASEKLMSTYLMPATGNHEEKDDFSTVSNFILPNMPEQDAASGVYYSFDYNSVHIAVLNTNDLNVNDELSETQIDWLKKDMSGSDARWKVVMLHKALYSNGSHYDDDDVCAMRNQLGSLMPQLDIDLVLQGHDHVYLRTYSLKDNKKADERITYLSYRDGVYKTFVKPSGTLYAIDGCAGVKIYRTKDVSATDKYFPRADETVDAYAPMFSAIQIKDGILYFDAYLVDGDDVILADSFAIQKDTEQGEIIPEDEWPDDPDEKQAFDLSALKNFIDIVKKILTVIKNLMNIFIFGSTEGPSC